MELNTQINALDVLPAGSREKQKIAEKNLVNYAVPNQLLIAFIRENGHILRVVEKDGSRSAFYRVLYFDTPRNRFLKAAQNGKRNRLMVRIRQNEQSGKSFLEMRYTGKKGRPVRRRMETDGINKKFNAEETAFLKKAMPAKKIAKLSPRLEYSFHRMVLTDGQERMRIHSGVRFKNEQDVIRELDFSFVQLTRERYAPDGIFSEFLRNSGIRPSNNNKYVLGMSIFAGDYKPENRLNKIMQ